jgi:hypothetical protein
MIRRVVIAMGLAGVGLFAAAPAMADSPDTTVGCSPCVVLEDTMAGLNAIPGQTIENIWLLPGQAASRLAEVPSFPQQTIDNIRALPGQAAARLAEVPSFPQQTMDNIRNLPQQAADNINNLGGN